MSGTNGSLLIQDNNLVEGYINQVASGFNLNINFINRVGSAMVHNNSGDYIQVRVITTPLSVGNELAYLAPGSAMSFGKYHGSHIDTLEIDDLIITGNGNGVVIVNGLYN